MIIKCSRSFFFVSIFNNNSVIMLIIIIFGIDILMMVVIRVMVIGDLNLDQSDLLLRSVKVSKLSSDDSKTYIHNYLICNNIKGKISQQCGASVFVNK